jgi:hypothetical protein
VQHPRITKKVMLYNGRFFHVANLRDADDLDDALRAHLTESYLTAPE